MWLRGQLGCLTLHAFVCVCVCGCVCVRPCVCVAVCAWPCVRGAVVLAGIVHNRKRKRLRHVEKPPHPKPVHVAHDETHRGCCSQRGLSRYAAPGRRHVACIAPCSRRVGVAVTRRSTVRGRTCSSATASCRGPCQCGSQCCRCSARERQELHVRRAEGVSCTAFLASGRVIEGSGQWETGIEQQQHRY